MAPVALQVLREMLVSHAGARSDQTIKYILFNALEGRRRFWARFVTAIFIAIVPATLLAEVTIVDGDTFDLEGTRIRVNGIDAPEFAQTCGKWRCGEDSLQMLDRLIQSGSVKCKGLGEDGYGRTIGVCTVNGLDIGAEMVRSGMAYAFVKYSDVYIDQEAIARENRVGIWQGDFQKPWDYRAEKWAVAEQEAPQGCPIKGNISENGHIYHAPWSPWYRKTKVSEEQGERWFCSEAEAVAAGWRAPMWR